MDYRCPYPGCGRLYKNKRAMYRHKKTCQKANNIIRKPHGSDSITWKVMEEMMEKQMEKQMNQIKDLVSNAEPKTQINNLNFTNITITEKLPQEGQGVSTMQSLIS